MGQNSSQISEAETPAHDGARAGAASPGASLTTPKSSLNREQSKTIDTGSTLSGTSGSNRGQPQVSFSQNDLRSNNKFEEKRRKSKSKSHQQGSTTRFGHLDKNDFISTLTGDLDQNKVYSSAVKVESGSLLNDDLGQSPVKVATRHNSGKRKGSNIDKNSIQQVTKRQRRRYNSNAPQRTPPQTPNPPRQDQNQKKVLSSQPVGVSASPLSLPVVSETPATELNQRSPRNSTAQVSAVETPAQQKDAFKPFSMQSQTPPQAEFPHRRASVKANHQSTRVTPVETSALRPALRHADREWQLQVKVPLKTFSIWDDPITEVPEDDTQSGTTNANGLWSAPFSRGKPRNDKKRMRRDRTLEEIIEAKGTGLFSLDEERQMHAFRDQYCEEHDLSPFDFNALVIKKRTRGDVASRNLWKEMMQVLPYRANLSLRRFCRRLFNNYEKRGAWTKEEDDALVKAILQVGKHWRQVGELIGRLEDDCWDRYRNYHQTKGQVVRKEWSLQEIQHLQRVIGDLLYNVLEGKWREARDLGRSDDFTLTEEECMKLISWPAVSRRMEGRSRLQCLKKWRELKDQRKSVSYTAEVQAAEVRAKTGCLDVPELNDYGRVATKAQEPNIAAANGKEKLRLLARDQINMLKAVQLSDFAMTGDILWKEIRKRSTKLSMFDSETLHRTWGSIRVRYDRSTRESTYGMKPQELAKQMRKWLKNTVPKEERRLRWARSRAGKVYLRKKKEKEAVKEAKTAKRVKSRPKQPRSAEFVEDSADEQLDAQEG